MKLSFGGTDLINAPMHKQRMYISTKLSKTPIPAYCEGEVEPKVFATMLNNIKIYWMLDIDLVV